jgi:hypothetical protein
MSAPALISTPARKPNGARCAPISAFRPNWNGVGDGLVDVDQAWIALGGLRMGYTESAWAETYVGGVSTSGSHSDNAMGYGDQQRALIQYNYRIERLLRRPVA